MATISTSNKTINPITINKFLGLNMPRAGDTQLTLGESGNMYNCYITRDYSLSKIEGYKQLITSISTDKKIQGIWSGAIGGTDYFLFACNGHVYRFNNDYWLDDSLWGDWESNTQDLGTLTDAPTTFFSFNDIVYMINGYEFKKWIGTGTIFDVEGYIPKIRIGCTPSTGGGTEYEGANLLTGKKRLTYIADGTTTYQLPETNINSVDFVKVYGVIKTVGTDYTVNLTTGVVTFSSGPTHSSDEDDVEIYYTKGSGDRDNVIKNRFVELYGESGDTRVFMYGNEDNPNVRINSSLADSVPSAEYYTATNIDNIGSASFAITAIIQQQNIMLIHTNKPETYYSYYDSVDLDGVDVINFPIIRINSARGNVAFGQAQLLNNDIYTIDTTLIKWSTTTIEDERNVKEIGSRIQKDLNEYDLRKAITYDYQNRFELWIAIGKRVWIYNYKLDVFSKLILNDEPTCFLSINGKLYFGTTEAKIIKFSEDYFTFNGEAISSHWEMNMYDFEANYLTKSMNYSWITLSSQSKVEVNIKYVTDKDNNPIPYEITYDNITFNDTDFNNFSFITNFTPKIFRVRFKSKKFTYLKAVIDNSSTTQTFNILNITLKPELGGYVK